MKDAAQRLAWALQACRRLQMRLTPVREKILAFLATQRVPVSLNTLMQSEQLRRGCDATTAYRTLMLLREVEVLRQVSLPDKVSFFVLNVPGENNHFLICRQCGAITELPAGSHCEHMEHDVAATHGYTQLYHELQFFGICPACQQLPAPMKSAKLPVAAGKHGDHKSASRSP
jgi:Fur family transcriptional regulator, ferric uptake regulator